jgi:hypothetical protein
MVSKSRLIALFLVTPLLGCGAPLMDPLPPENDAANPDAPIPAYAQTPNALETSAFEGQKMDGGGHEHHDHEGHGKNMDRSKHDASGEKMDHSQHRGQGKQEAP